MWLSGQLRGSQRVALLTSLAHPHGSNWLDVIVRADTCTGTTISMLCTPFDVYLRGAHYRVTTYNPLETRPKASTLVRLMMAKRPYVW